VLFQIEKNKMLKKVEPTNFLSELQVENYLISKEETEDTVLNADIFKEDLLLIDNQTRTKDKKRADILALDKRGNLVVIELKKDSAKLGVDMQALQYLAAFSEFKGQAFINKFKSKSNDLEARVYGFIEGLDVEKLNQKGRIILIAQSFDNSLLSMGEWLSSQGVAFRCLQYNQLEIGERKFLSFSVYFDRSSEALHPLRFSEKQRNLLSETPQIYWHNIGDASEKWWGYCVNKKFIATSFDNAPGDRGEAILKSYIKGDKVIAYAKGYGAIGWGIITSDPNKSYKLVGLDSVEDYAKGRLRHRLSIEWERTLDLSNGIKASDLKKDFSIYPPVQTSSLIKSADNAERLITAINQKTDNHEQRRSN